MTEGEERFWETRGRTEEYDRENVEAPERPRSGERDKAGFLCGSRA